MSTKLPIKASKKPIDDRFYVKSQSSAYFHVWKVIAVLTVLISFNTSAETDNNNLSFSQAIKKTVENNPELKTFQYLLNANTARVTQSQLNSRPEVGLNFEDFAGTDDFRGLNSVQSTLSVSWVLENELISSRHNLASQAERIINDERKIKLQRVASETARIFIKALAQQQQMEIIKQAVTFSDAAVIEIKKKVSAGRSPQEELLRAEAEFAKQNLILEDLKHELLISYRSLSAQWGDTLPRFKKVSGTLNTIQHPVAFTEIRQQLEQNPIFAKFTSLEQINEAKIRLAIAENKPRWKLMTGLRRYERTDDVAFVAGLSIPFGSKNRSEGRIAEIKADISRDASEREALRISLEASLFAFHQLMSHNVHLAEILKNDIIPKLKQAKEKTYQAYLAGKYGYMDLKIVQNDLIEAQLSLLEANLSFHINKIEIEALTGAQLSSNQKGQ